MAKGCGGKGCTFVSLRGCIVGGRANSGGGEQTADVLDHDPLGTEAVNGIDHVGPETGTGAWAKAGHLPDSRDVLTGEAAAENFHRFDSVPVNYRDVAEVLSMRPMSGEHAADGFVNFGEPDRARPEDLLYSEVKAAVAREERSDLK